MPTRCCCIIPLRGGSVIISLLILVVSAALLAATLTHKNPMVMHLPLIHPILPWIYTIVLAVSAGVALYGVLATLVGKLFLMRFYKLLFWVLTFLTTVWQAGSFVLALIKRPDTLTACNLANPVSNDTTTANTLPTLGHDTSFAVAGFNTTFLGMQIGNTYGLANCNQAVQAGVIGIGILLFFGAIFMFYFASVIASYTTKLRERSLGHRLRDAEWDDFKEIKKDGNKFTDGLKKLRFGKK